MAISSGKKGVLVVDDSAFMRKVLSEIISGSEEFEVAGTAGNGEDALAKLAVLGGRVELVTLDIEMPRMDGLTCLRRIMSDDPHRVVMISSLTTEGAAETLSALEAGAVDFLAKPGGTSISLSFKEVGSKLLGILHTAAGSRLPQRQNASQRLREQQRLQDTQKRPERPVLAVSSAAVPSSLAQRVIAVASSTGGPKALASFIPLLPADIKAAIVLVQHMPASFTGLMADRLNKVSNIEVREAQEGDQLRHGLCLLAPGGSHMEITAQQKVHLTKDPPVGGLRPCADITFRSVANTMGRRTLGVVLTGMGSDGTEGCKALRAKGCPVVLAESRETATIWGMPRSVVEKEIADREVPIQDMAAAVMAELAQV